MLVPDSKTIRKKASHKWISSPEEELLTVFTVMPSQKSGGAILLCTSLYSDLNLILGISASGCIDIRMMGKGREGTLSVSVKLLMICIGAKKSGNCLITFDCCVLFFSV